MRIDLLQKFGSYALLIALLVLIAVSIVTNTPPRPESVQANKPGATAGVDEIAASTVTPTPTRRVQPPTNTATPIPTLTATNTPRPTFTPTPTPQAVALTQTTPHPLITLIDALNPRIITAHTVTPTRTNTPRPTFTPGTLLAPANSPIATPSPPSATPTPTLLPTPIAEGVVARVPILMYHFLSVPPADADIYQQDLSVTPENFEAQLAYLKEAGYTTITLNDLTYHLAGLKPLPEKPIILTFDDGYADNYTHAFPLLQKYGFQASFFLVTQPIDFNDPRYMTWDNVIEMHAAGMEFGAHTYRHLDLRGRDVDFLIYEIIGSKEAIEARTQETVRYFVYPAGKYDQTVLDVLASAHFWGALTTQYGYEYALNDSLQMPRIRMRNSDTLTSFINKVNVED